MRIEIYQFNLKCKTTESNSTAKLNFVVNQLLLFLHFPDLSSLVIYEESIFLCYSLPNKKVVWIDYILLSSPYKFI